MAIKSEAVEAAQVSRRSGEARSVEARSVFFTEAFRFGVKPGFISYGAPSRAHSSPLT
jgi:hypothetical protein